MAHSSKIPSSTNPAHAAPATAGCTSQVRKSNRLQDEVYREMLFLEMERPGAEMGLALALLRAVVQSDSLSHKGEFGQWLNAVCPVALHMIEGTLRQGCRCDRNQRQAGLRT
jgi:hypothetical protein